MSSIELEKKEEEVYQKIIKEGTMEMMFEFAYAIGRERKAKEILDMISKRQKKLNNFNPMKTKKLYEIPSTDEGTKIYCECSDGSEEYINFFHIDGAYSYCKSKKGAVVHLGASTKLEKYKDGYKIKEEVIKKIK